MSRNYVKVFAGAAMIAALPIFAQAQTVAFGTSSPIVVTALRVDSHFAPWAAAGGYSLQAGLSALPSNRDSVALQFINHGHVAATAVTFVLNTGRESRSIVDKGVFSPGVPIEHTFSSSSDLAGLSDAACVVAEVEFADGSIWHAPNGELMADSAKL